MKSQPLRIATGLQLISSEVILLSRYSAGTIKNAMDRVANVVLASVVGALDHSRSGVVRKKDRANVVMGL